MPLFTCGANTKEQVTFRIRVYNLLCDYEHKLSREGFMVNIGEEYSAEPEIRLINEIADNLYGEYTISNQIKRKWAGSVVLSATN